MLLMAVVLVLTGEADAARIRRTIHLAPQAGVQCLGPYAMLPDPETGRLFVLAEGSNNLCVLDPDGGRIVGAVPLAHSTEFRGGMSWQMPQRLLWAWGRQLLAGMERGVWLVDPHDLRVVAQQSWPDHLVSS